MSRISKLEGEVAHLTKIRDGLDMVFGTICIVTIITAIIICPIMIRL
jgi:hypothetical protein